MKHNIHTAHILTRNGTEIMPGTVTGLHMYVVILHNMANQPNIVRTAPITQLIGKAGLIQMRYHIHISRADFRMAAVLIIQPKPRQAAM